jgi:hypothetical protein
MTLYSQCSDAGICIIGKKSTEYFRKYNSSTSFIYTLGNGGGHDKIKYASIILESDLQVAKFFNITARMPFNFNKGALGKTSGPGDFMIAGTMLIPIQGIAAFTLSLGGKLATGRVNAGDSLAQEYQPGLGTNDLLIGAGFISPRYNFNIAYQKPFGRSANKKSRLKRGDDLMFRAGYNIQSKQVNLKGELIAIKRFGISTIKIYGSDPEMYTNAENSEIFQINVTAYFTFMFSNRFESSGFFSVPVLKRDTNYDGTKRTISGGFSFLYRFRL